MCNKTGHSIFTSSLTHEQNYAVYRELTFLGKAHVLAFIRVLLDEADNAVNVI